MITAIVILGPAILFLAAVSLRAALARGNRNIARVIAEWEAQCEAAPADSTYLDPHRGDGPVLVAPDEGMWREGWRS